MTLDTDVKSQDMTPYADLTTLLLPIADHDRLAVAFDHHFLSFFPAQFVNQGLGYGYIVGVITGLGDLADRFCLTSLDTPGLFLGRLFHHETNRSALRFVWKVKSDKA